MRSYFVFYFILASALATIVLSHDLLYKPYQRASFEKLPDTIPIYKKFSAFKSPKALHLPSIKSTNSHGNRCPKQEQACLLSSGQQGCCPFENGTCCLDKLTCCPFGYDCNIKEGACTVRTDNNMHSRAVVCQDGQSQCPDGSTCCKLQSGQWGCCPLERATCCNDGIHCCPNGYKCDVSAGTCTKGDIVHSLTKTKVKSTTVVCPDGQSQCPDGSTCCKLQSGQWGCCPLEKATCCNDGIHCCPNGYKCDVSAGTCTKGDIVHSLTKTMVKSTTVVCPDGQSQCPDGSTCCKLQSGQWGCCPLERATCCNDGIHCCPNGYKCDVSAGTCTKGDIVHSLTKTKVKSTTVVCPDGQSQCPDGSTCCKLQSGQWGCCPLERATCCNDGIHCCPNGYKCDVSAGTCTKGDIVHSLTKTMVKSTTVVCPDGQSQCPDGSTCCKLQSGQWGCCPLERATCCNDGIHCCPNGYKCDVSAGTCTKGDIVHSLTKTMVKSTTVVCPDGQSQCPDGSTCCKLQSGQWGCCPLERATCCNDGIHCCPNGYKCDVSAGTCTKGDIVHSLTKTKVKSTTVVCPDGQSQCPDGSTCCKLQSGQWGCCPLEKATCCNDGIHCCPNGYKCDVSAGTCTKGDIVHSLTKTMVKSTTVVCPDGQSQCPDGSTCCKLQSGQWGCCPLEKATCCNDGIHCCPNGYKCDVSAGTCTKGDIVHSLTKTKVKSTTVVCPDGHSQCPDGSTCCKLQSGQWGCCPLERATCCNDGIHCCPNGYKCDVSAGTCTKGDIVHSLTKTKVKSTTVVCPDGQSQCPDGSTCCKLQSGQWGCCPLERATCCNDGIHCCPNGYKCDVSAGTCTKGTSMSLRARLSSCCTFVSGSVLCCKNGLICNPETYQCSSPISEVDQTPTTDPVHTEDASVPPSSSHVSMFLAQRRLVACAAGFSCGSKSTCCITESGTSKCCSHSNGVCCAGGAHCCPGGYSCSANGKCAIVQLP